MSAFEFIKEKERLVLRYNPYASNRWLMDQYEDVTQDRIRLGRAFSFPKRGVIVAGKGDLASIQKSDGDISSTPGYWEFALGVKDGDGYYVIDKEILGLNYDCLIYEKVKLSRSFFYSGVGSIPILQKLDKYIHQSIVIGGKRDDAISADEYLFLRRTLPSAYWTNRYAESQIEHQLAVYYDVKGEAEARFEKYLDKKRVEIKRIANRNVKDRRCHIEEYELAKYEYIRDRIKELLLEATPYSEDEWSKEIMKIILLLYPKYIQALYKVTIPIRKEDGCKATRQLDILLLDADGHIDVIEIKKPGDKDIFSSGTYRGNKYPGHTLAGTVMQMESYLFHLKKGGYELEEYVNKHCKSQLLKDMCIQVINPKGILILGRSKDFNIKQKQDFEIIRRKYSSIMDIVTYDDLLHRLENVIQGIKGRASL
jgi:hypothetical protein